MSLSLRRAKTAIDIATASCIEHSGIAIGSDLNIIRSNENGCFLAYYLTGPKKLTVARLAQGNSVVHLYGSQLSSILFFMSLRSEQDKIAKFLRTVDEKLENMQRKWDLLIDYKRGVIQKIFSRQLRFKENDGTDFIDWKPKKFGDLYEWVNTNSFSREMLTHEGGSVQNIHYGDIHTRYRARFRQEQEQVPYIRSAAFPKSISEDLFCRVGDLVIADASEDYADIGKAIEIVSVKPKSLVAGLHTYIARPRNEKDKIVVGFSGYMFSSSEVRKQIKRIAQGIAVLGVSKRNLSNLSLLLPQPDEQQKIADFLSAIDDKILAVSSQITQMEAFKKGLLQQMFV